MEESKSNSTPSKEEVPKFSPSKSFASPSAAVAMAHAAVMGRNSRKRGPDRKGVDRRAIDRGSGRFSLAHRKAFARMDSIQDHWSVRSGNKNLDKKSENPAESSNREVHIFQDDSSGNEDEHTAGSAYETEQDRTPGKRTEKITISSAAKRRKMDVSGRKLELKSSGSRMDLFKMFQENQKENIPEETRESSRLKSQKIDQNQTPNKLKAIPASRSTIPRSRTLSSISPSKQPENSTKPSSSEHHIHVQQMLNKLSYPPNQHTEEATVKSMLSTLTESPTSCRLSNMNTPRTRRIGPSLRTPSQVGQNHAGLQSRIPRSTSISNLRSASASSNISKSAKGPESTKSIAAKGSKGINGLDKGTTPLGITTPVGSIARSQIAKSSPNLNGILTGKHKPQWR